LIFEEDEELLLAKLNLNAAKAAKSSIAYATAINYLETGLDYLRGKDAWYQHYTLTFQLYFEQAETEYLNGEVDKSTATIQKMLRYVQDPCDVASVNNLLIIQKTMQANYEEAIEIARNTLRLFQVDLAKENIDLALQAEIVDFKSLLNEVSIESIFRLEEMTDREQRAIMKVLYNVLATCYIYNPILYALVGIMMASLSLKYGRNSTESCVGYSCYGMVACNLLNDFKTGLEFAQLSIRLSDKFHDPIQKARACTVLGLLVNHWVKPLKESEQILDEGYQEGVKAGELQFSGYLLFGKAIILFYSGVSLKQSLVEVEKYIAYAKKTKNQITINAIQAIHFAMEGLITRPTENNQQFIEDCLMHRSYVALCCYYIATAQLEYMYDNIRGALEAIGMAQKYLPNALGFFFASLYGWWHSLILLKQYPQVSSDEQENILQIIGSYQKQMQQWAASCPQNFIFRELLIEAELCSIKRQYWEAESFYEQAITEARENGFMFGEILCSELFAQFLLATARNARAKELISKVYKGYKALGADGKVNMVSKKYATLLYEPLPTDVTTLYQRSYPEEISATRIASFDVESIIKCSHILSSNMDPESLLVDGMQIIIENAGAEKGAILLIEGELYVHVERLANGTIEINKKSLTDWNGGCKSIISYVRRTLKPVIVGDASYQSEYSNDPYIRDNAVQSILCIPVLQRKALYAILYLQNDSVKFAFTQNHFDILVVLSSQLAISLKNANYLQKLKQSEENYRVLASASPVGLLRVNIRTNEILYMNDKASGMMGIDFQPNMLVNWKNYIFAEDHDLINQDWQHAVTHERHFKAEFRFQGQNQPVIWVISEAEPQCNDKGEIISYVMTITDISERKEIERLAAIEQEDKKQRELREQAKIFEDREKTYARHMYHELRNPLQGIMSSAESILFTLHKLVARETQPAFRLIEQPNIKDSLEQITGDAQAILLGAKHQQAVTDDALRAASLLEHAIKLEKQPVDVKGLLVDIILLYKRRCEGKGLLLNIDAPDENILIIADPLRLREVIINLVANAIKFTEHGGITLIVSYKNLNHNHIALTIIVKDTGIGMSESIQKKLFFPFAQASSSTHAKYGGTGLGLYIAKMTIELMQGNISVKSKEGEGSEFSITLECTRAKPEEVATSTATIYKAVPVKSPTEAKSILVVEDNTINRTVLKRTLEQEGYNCMAAENGQIALNMYNDLEQHFDMIFMDVEMPIMGGIEATQLIRKEEQEQGKIPVIIIGLSGNAQAEDIKTGLRVGMNEYLIKPIDRSNLRQCLERFFTTSPQAGPSQQRSSIAHP